MAVLNVGTAMYVTVQDVKTKVGCLRAIGEVRMDSDMVDVTTLDAEGGFRMYEKGLKSAGDVTLDGFVDKSEGGQSVLRNLYLSDAAAAFEIQYPDGEMVQFRGLVKSLALGGGEVDGVVRFSAVVRITGPVAFQ